MVGLYSFDPMRRGVDCHNIPRFGAGEGSKGRGEG
jgi:hypothetical protein